MRSPLLLALGALLELVLGSVAGSALPAQVPVQKRVVGYYTSWSIYARNYNVTDIPGKHVTHINYAFAKIASGRIALGDRWADVDKSFPGDSSSLPFKGNFNQLLKFKKANPHIKTLISIGGSGSSGFSTAASTATNRRTFATSCVDFIVKYGFDGVDIDWEFPRSADKVNFTLLMAELRSQLDQKSKTTNRPYLLTIATSPNPSLIQYLELPKLSRYVDWVNIMTYNYHGPWGGSADKVTNFHTLLYPTNADPTGEPAKSWFFIDHAIRVYDGGGMPRHKLLVGCAFYARGYGSVLSSGNGLYAAYSGSSPIGTYVNGYFDYTDLKANFISKNGYRYYWHPEARVPWLYNPQKQVFISFDDSKSMREKAWFAKAQDLGGVMIWALSQDKTNELVGILGHELLQRPSLVAATREISVSNPARLTLSLRAGSKRAGRLYYMVASASGRHPGLVLPGDTLPLNPDPVFDVSIALAGSKLFPNSLGQLDPNGAASPGVDASGLKPLPKDLIGRHMTLAAWVLRPKAGLTGEATNAVDVFFKQ
ncbi:MAG: glycoside hydrolase family 18 protein [Planctomycetota bacterium]|jgi:chitinase